MVDLPNFIIAPPLLSKQTANLEETLVVKLLLSRKLVPKFHFLFGVELDMAQFFLFSSLDLHINLVFGLSDESIEVLEVSINLLLKLRSER
jgi:hypothetical protein